MVELLLKIDDDNEEEENNYSDNTYIFFIALFPAERAPDEDDDKDAGSGDNRSTKNITCARSAVFC